MKALMKLAGAAKFFQKVQRKKEVVSDQERMYQSEEAILADEIGIDPREIPVMRWFFDQTRLMKLPTHWRRQFVDGAVQYVNDATGQLSNIHPNVDLLKVFFYERLANDQASATFTDKSRKLLPHIEEKLTKEMIGLSSKRKDAEKVNLKRDENGKVVTSKTERIAPDTSKLIASRNYLLKSIVDKVVTKSQLWGYGKRARQFALLLDRSKNSKAGIGEQDEQVETLELMDRIYSEAYEFYDSEYGQLSSTTTKLDDKVLKILTPETVVTCLHLLNVDKQQIEHYWFGRLLNCMILPPMWRRQKGKSFDEFIYEPKSLTFDLHPSFVYMLVQRNRFQSQFEVMPLAQQQYYLSFRQMKFVDFFQRTFEVDMYALMDSYQKQMQKAAREKQPVNDWMLVEGIVEAQVPQQQYLLAEQIEIFWRNRNFPEENYKPSVSPFGQVVWSHNITGSSMEQCPYRAEIERFLAPHSRSIPPVQATDYNPIYQQLTELDGFEQYCLQENLNERISFLSHYIQGPQNVAHPIPEYLTTEDYFDCVFSCPFDFERELNLTDENQPLWIEICRAAKLQRMLKQVVSQLSDQDSIDRYYNVVKKYYLDITLRLEPDNLDTVRASLAQSIQKQQLLKLIDFVFNVRQREERLGRNKPPPEPEEQKKEEDIFGSEQSQIDLNQLSSDEDEEDYPILPPDKVALMRQGGEPEDQPEPIIDDLEDLYNKKQSTVKQPSEPEKSETEKQVTEEQPVEEYESEQVMDSRIKLARKKSLKVHKFSRAAANRTNHLVEKVKNIVNPDDRLRSKKDLLLTNLKKEQLPNKHNIVRSPVRPSLVASQAVANESVSIGPFNSVASNYTNTSVVELIRKLPPKPILPPPEPNVVEQSPSPIKLIKVSDTQEQQTEQDSVLQLTPIVKDSIRNDPVLRHISQFKELSDFTLAFGYSRYSTAEPESRQLSKHNFLPQNSKFEDMDRQTIRSSQRLLRPSSNQKPTATATNFRKLPSPERQRFESTTNSFKRRCVSSTASHLLNSNAITSKLVFSKIEVRKELYLRNRGIFGDFLPRPAVL